MVPQNYAGTAISKMFKNVKYGDNVITEGQFITVIP